MRTIGFDERTVMGALDVEECLLLLRWETLGRLAFAAPDEAPVVVPVNFALDGETVVFRSDARGKLDRIRGKPASLEVDKVDWYRRVGWSVLVRGVANEFVPPETWSVELDPWAPGSKDHWLRIVPTEITGRRLELANLTPPRRASI